MNLKHIQLFVIAFVFIFLSCRKEAGQGGDSSIRGKVYAKYYDKDFLSIADTGYAPDTEVFIIYGDEYTYGDRQKTSYNGSFEFKYLRPGQYKIYCYSRDSTGLYKGQINKNSPDMVIIKNTEITKKKQIVEIADFKILQ